VIKILAPLMVKSEANYSCEEHAPLLFQIQAEPHILGCQYLVVPSQYKVLPAMGKTIYVYHQKPRLSPELCLLY